MSPSPVDLSKEKRLRRSHLTKRLAFTNRITVKEEHQMGLLKKLGFLILLLFHFSLISAQQLIENSNPSFSKKPGRILKLEELLSIKDDPPKFYFDRPTKVLLYDRENLLVVDGRGSNLIRMSRDGSFIENLCHQGEGPGEILASFYCNISGLNIYLYDYYKQKMVIEDINGTLINEIKLKYGVLKDFVGIFQDFFVFRKNIIPPSSQRAKSQFINDQQYILLISKDGTTVEETYSFPTKTYYFANENGKGFDVWAIVKSVYDEKKGLLYVSHTREYLLHILDIQKKQIKVSFKREFKRNKYVIGQREAEAIKSFNIPKKKYSWDILDLFLRDGLLWVLTSERDDQKGVCIDVFNDKGEYIDNFYLDIAGDLISVEKDFLFVRDSNQEGNYIIKMYRIND